MEEVCLLSQVRFKKAPSKQPIYSYTMTIFFMTQVFHNDLRGAENFPLFLKGGSRDFAIAAEQQSISRRRGILLICLMSSSTYLYLWGVVQDLSREIKMKSKFYTLSDVQFLNPPASLNFVDRVDPL